MLGFKKLNKKQFTIEMCFQVKGQRMSPKSRGHQQENNRASPKSALKKAPPAAVMANNQRAPPPQAARAQQSPSPPLQPDAASLVNFIESG